MTPMKMRNKMIPDPIRKLFLPSGLKKAVIAFIAALILLFLDFEFFASLAFFATLFLLFAYRNPKRNSVDLGDYGVVAPVDGKVVAIEHLTQSQYGFLVEIDSSWLDSGVLRTPFEAAGVEVELYRGSRLPLSSPLSTQLNERCGVLFFKENRRVKVEHMLRRCVLEAECFVMQESQLACCQNYGFAFRSRTRLYLPKEFRLNISVGTKVRASLNIIGYFSK